MTTRYLLLSCAAAAACGNDAEFTDAAVAPDARADAAVVEPDAEPPDAGPVVLTAPETFAPALGTLCGIGYDHVADRVWIYPCSGAEIHGFTTAGVAAGTIARPGEAANDVDVAIMPTAQTIGTTAVVAGAMLFVNGEAGTADVHLPDTAASTPLVTMFGADHVVGGAYHAGRGTLFLVQDRVSGTSPNTIAEIDRVTGAVVGSFSTLPAFDVNYGDLEVCQTTGNLFVVSSIETTIAELTPAGALVAEYALPAEATSASGLALGPDGEAWISGTSGDVWQIAGLPCGAR
jgi:hypothetical protein